MEYRNIYRARVERSSSSDDDPYVMYLIVNESLSMSVGKTAAQVGHAVNMLCEVVFGLSKKKNLTISELHIVNNYSAWANRMYRKVVLRCKDKQWESIKQETDYVLVRDAGLTEISPGSETVIGLFPMLKSQAPNIIKKLQVL